MPTIAGRRAQSPEPAPLRIRVRTSAAVALMMVSWVAWAATSTYAASLARRIALRAPHGLEHTLDGLGGDAVRARDLGDDDASSPRPPPPRTSTGRDVELVGLR